MKPEPSPNFPSWRGSEHQGIREEIQRIRLHLADIENRLDPPQGLTKTVTDQGPVFYWHGRNILTLSREDLIKVVIALAKG